LATADQGHRQAGHLGLTPSMAISRL
jgi:hypothetical protein